MYVAYYLHWSQAEILDLDHRNRTTVIERISAIHTEQAPSVQATPNGFALEDWS